VTSAQAFDLFYVLGGQRFWYDRKEGIVTQIKGRNTNICLRVTSLDQHDTPERACTFAQPLARLGEGARIDSTQSVFEIQDQRDEGSQYGLRLALVAHNDGVVAFNRLVGLVRGGRMRCGYGHD